MAPSPVKEATFQAVLLSGVANMLAQYIESYKNEVRNGSKKSHKSFQLNHGLLRLMMELRIG